MSYRVITIKESSFIEANYLTKNDHSIGETIGLTNTQVRNFRFRNGLTKQVRNPFTKEEGEFIKANYMRLDDSKLAEALGRNRLSVKNYRDRNKLWRRSRTWAPMDYLNQQPTR
jgi:hypothetical protein